MTATVTRVGPATRGVRFSGTGAGPATQLAVTTQPGGAEDALAFTQQPVIEVRDAQGNRRTDYTGEVTVSKATGSGTLAGDTAVNAVAGVATFTDLEIQGTGAHSLSFAASGLTGATSSVFDVDSSGGGGTTVTPLFFSNWRGVTPGETSAAVGDGGKWDAVVSNFNDDRLTVIANPGNLGFPASIPNLLRIRAPLNDDPGLRKGHSPFPGWGTPPVGGHLYRRLYVRFHFTGDDNSDNLQHWIMQEPANGAWAWQCDKGNAGSPFPFMFQLGNIADNGWQIHRFAPVGDLGLERDVTYRIEDHLHRTGEITFTYEAWIYDSETETLLYGPGDLVCIYGHGSHLMSEVGEMTATSAASFDGFRGIRLAHEGCDYGGEEDNYILIAAVAISDEARCEEHENVTGEAA